MRFGMTIALGFSSVCLLAAAAAEQASQAKPEALNPPSVQQQIDDLRAGQQQLRDELGQIKALLRERAPRADYPTKPIPPENITLGVQGEVFRGNSQARVALMEYSDFDCSFCAKFTTEVYPRIETDYIQTGKLRFYFRDLPSPEHTNSLF